MTHWRQSYFPMRTMPVEAGDRLQLSLRAVRRGSGDSRLPLYFLEGEHEREGRVLDSFFYRYYGSFE